MSFVFTWSIAIFIIDVWSLLWWLEIRLVVVVLCCICCSCHSTFWCKFVIPQVIIVKIWQRKGITHPAIFIESEIQHTLQPHLIRSHASSIVFLCIILWFCHSSGWFWHWRWYYLLELHSIKLLSFLTIVYIEYFYCFRFQFWYIPFLQFC